MTKGQQIYSVNGQMVNILGFPGHMVTVCTQLCQRSVKQLQIICKQTRIPYFLKTLFTNTDNGLTLSSRPLFASPYQRLLREINKPESVEEAQRRAWRWWKKSNRCGSGANFDGGYQQSWVHYFRSGLLAVGIEGEERPLSYNPTPDLSFLLPCTH